MVQRLQSFDDFDGSAAVETVQYSYAGRDYEIDLNEQHAQELDEFLAKYVEHSRTVERAAEPQPRRRRARRGGGERRTPEELQAIRQWARQQGFQVSDRGRIKADILEKYDTAH